MPAWTPPEKLLPITPQVYAGLRTFIDGGTKVAAARLKNIEAGCRKDCTPGSDPPIDQMAIELYTYIPAATIPLPAESRYLTTDGQVAAYELDETDRPSIFTFEVDRQVLLDALNDATPVDVLEQFNNADPNDEGLPWWAVALAAGGVLALLGKLNWRGALLSRVSAKLLAALAAAGLFSDLSEGAKQVLDGLKKAAKSALGALPWALGGAALLGVGYLAVRSSGNSSSVRVQLEPPPA